ncbi:SIP domain-containing protein [Plantibacter sp. YIM 135347]|uniref:SIP domain-containing protein n=1 Tax=Plantibacter sp. YIM 135347 TaxID=3423919 RepID=UPI003D327436
MSYFADPAEFAVADARHVLLAGDASSIAEIDDVLGLLPICARGQVFVEVDHAEDVRTLTGPGRVVVTWLVRADRTGEPGSGRGCASGQAVSRAARAWASEMLDVDGHESADYHVWVGGGSAHLVELRNELRMTLASSAAAKQRQASSERASH